MKICHILWVISFFEIEHQLRNRLNRDNKTNGLVWGAATLIVQTDLKGDREVEQLFCYSGVRTRTLSWFISMWILWLMKKKIRYLQYFYSVGRLELGALFVDPLSLNSIGGGGGGGGGSGQSGNASLTGNKLTIQPLPMSCFCGLQVFIGDTHQSNSEIQRSGADGNVSIILLISFSLALSSVFTLRPPYHCSVLSTLLYFTLLYFTINFSLLISLV